MIVRSHNVEFGYELAAALPYAYWNHLNGTLEETISGSGSEPFYFFSNKHTIDPSPRDFSNTSKAAAEIPNMWIHKAELDRSRWTPPPLADHYKDAAIKFDKPTVVIYNRYNFEWDMPPINYFSLPALRRMIDLLLPKYEVVYFNVRGEEALEDNAHSMDLGDYAMLRKEYPSVRIIHDLVRQEKQDYNTVQLRVFAGCRKFITMNGAPSMLASYFGGENIIYSKRCRELGPSVGSFHGWYHLFNPSDPSHIRLVNTEGALIEEITNAWVVEKPLINVLVRCHNRPEGFSRMLDSIKAQEYGNVRILCSYDNDETLKYVTRKRVTRIRVHHPRRTAKPIGDDYKAWLPANDYLNKLSDLVTGGYIVYMDDDDVFEKGAFKKIIAQASKDSVLLWRVAKRDGGLVPSEEHLGTITAGNISGIGVCFHSIHKDKAKWTPWRRGDYRFIRDLCAQIPPKYINDVLTRMCARTDKAMTSAGSTVDKAMRDRINAKVAAMMGHKK